MVGTFIEMEDRMRKSNEDNQKLFNQVNKKFQVVHKEIDEKVADDIYEAQITAESARDRLIETKKDQIKPLEEKAEKHDTELEQLKQ